MFFTYLGRVVAILTLVLGTYVITMGTLIATGFIGPYDDALAKYLPASSSIAEATDQGVYTLIFSIALGVVTDISFALRARRQSRVGH